MLSSPGSSCTCHVRAVYTNNGPNNGKVFSNCHRHLFKWHGSHNPPSQFDVPLAGAAGSARSDVAMLQAAAKALFTGSCKNWARGDVVRSWALFLVV